MKNTIIKKTLFNSIEIIEQDYIHLYIINDLSDELKNNIRENFSSICTGNNKNKYKSILKNFISITKKNNVRKTNKHLKGIVGELLAHILIKHNMKNFKIISILFNLEEESFKKSFDIVITDINDNSLWFTEIKSGQVNKNKINIQNKSQKKNMELLHKAKKDLNKRFNNIEQKDWWNAKNHAEKIIKDDSNDVLDLIDKLYDGDIKEFSKNVILVSVVFNDLKNKIDFYDTMKKTKKILNKKIFDNLIILSIQKSTYKKVITFLESELKEYEK